MLDMFIATDDQSRMLSGLKKGREWWPTPMVPVLGRQRPVVLCEFEADEP